jgi:hypothetical protein
MKNHWYEHDHVQRRPPPFRARLRQPPNDKQAEPSREAGHGRLSLFALMEGGTILDAGNLTAVERWCRDAGALSTGEMVTN